MSKKNREARRAAAAAETITPAEVAPVETTAPAGWDSVDTSTESDNMTPEELAAERERLMADAKAELEALAAPAPVTEARVATPATTRTASGPTVNPTSIRQIIRTGLLAGEDTKTIAAKVAAAHPSSAAAAKSVKHIAYYRSLMRKAGELPKVAR